MHDTSACDSVTLSVSVEEDADRSNDVEQLLSAGQNGIVDSTYHSILTSGGTCRAEIIDSNGEAQMVEIIAVTDPSAPGVEKVWQIMPTGLPVDAGGNGGVILVGSHGEGGQAVHIQSLSDSIPGLLMSSTTTTPSGCVVVTRPPPPDCPAWAQKLKDCEKIGHYYRGWVETEVELDMLLAYHKQQTASFWGTRQSPSSMRASARMMWKSQYVPFDGIPFINSGSRAIVMECQFGPRRKGGSTKKGNLAEFKQTCPARIYIKKVKKFPEFAVDINMDRKALKITMDKAFSDLKEHGFQGIGQERFYVQLPTEKAHEFHGELPAQSVMTFDLTRAFGSQPQRLDPRVAQKVRDIVCSGVASVTTVRKMLRKYVERELCTTEQTSFVPERHNLSYFPTVNDLQNHIHLALKDIKEGTLALAPGVQLSQLQQPLTYSTLHGDGSSDDQAETTVWSVSQNGGPHPETVTVTLMQHPNEEGHVISRVETHLSDGTTQVSNRLSPETAQLLAKLHPGVFSSTGALLQVVDGTVIAQTTDDTTATLVGGMSDPKSASGAAGLGASTVPGIGSELHSSPASAGIESTELDFDMPVDVASAADGSGKLQLC